MSWKVYEPLREDGTVSGEFCQTKHREVNTAASLREITDDLKEGYISYLE